MKKDPAVLVRMTKEEQQRLAALTENITTRDMYATPTSVAREAMNVGLRALELSVPIAAKLSFASRDGLAVAAIAIGLREIERNPAALIT